MASVAARFAKWLERGSPVTVGLPASGTQPGVPILPQQFGNSLNLVVEIAWGASPISNSSTWTWTDVTRDVKYNQQVQITPGRQDESSTPQPASCQLTLDNRSGNYSQGGQSVNYPNVKRGVPLRVRVIYNGTSYTRFFGYVADFTPAWDTTGRYAVVEITAAGAKRRLQQKKSGTRSALTRTILNTAPAYFWPLEDGNNASNGQPLVGSVLLVPIAVTAGGAVSWASDTSLLGAVQAPSLSVGEQLVSSPTIQNPTPLNTGWSFGIAQKITEVPSGTFSHVFIMNNGTGIFFSFAADMASFDVQFGATIVSGTTTTGSWHYYQFDVWQNGSDVTLDLYLDGVLVGSGTAASSTMAALSDFAINDAGALSVAHVAVWPGVITTAIAAAGLNTISGFNGEYVQTRLSRVAVEEGEYVSLNSGFLYQLCGTETPDTYLNTLEAAAKVDQGILYDGFAQGLSYISQDEMTSQAAAITLDASLGQLAVEVDPIDDDQLTTNEFTATRNNGSTYTYTDTLSSQSVNAIGVYDNSDSIDCYSDTQQLQDYASWKVGQGTFSGYRYPTVQVLLHRNPELLTSWLTAFVGCRLDISNLVNVRAQVQNGTVQLLMEGYQETIDQFTWSIKANCTPYDVWRVGEYSQEVGDTNPFVLRWDTDGTTTVAQVNPGDATCQVTTQAGSVLWTTDPDDFPVDLNIGGYRVAVTAISGSSNPQTLTLSWYTPLSATPVPPGAAVSLWMPTVIDVLAM